MTGTGWVLKSSKIKKLEHTNNMDDMQSKVRILLFKRGTTKKVEIVKKTKIKI